MCPSGTAHDYIRHGTVDLLAALNTATGKVIGKLSARHRAVDFRDFLGDIDRQTEPGLAIHVICDNYSVLTRLPGDARLAPADAARLLNARFPSPLVLSSSRTRRRPDPLSRLGIGRHRL